MNENGTYRTNDMGLVAYFYYNGVQEIKRDWDELKICWWVFDDNAILNSLFQSWLSGSALVEPRRYNSAYSSARRRFYEDRRTLLNI